MNFSYRKEQAKSIYTQNKQFASRLEKLTPSFSIQRLKKEHAKNQQYKRQISRTSLISKFNQISKKDLRLPTLSSTVSVSKRASSLSPLDYVNKQKDLVATERKVHDLDAIDEDIQQVHQLKKMSYAKFTSKKHS